jgi:hypothetical protein
MLKTFIRTQDFGLATSTKSGEDLAAHAVPVHADNSPRISKPAGVCLLLHPLRLQMSCPSVAICQKNWYIF